MMATEAGSGFHIVTCKDMNGAAETGVFDKETLVGDSNALR